MRHSIYDDPAFFEGYSRLRRAAEGLTQAPEWPSLSALLPDFAGLRVVDLGCGFGWFCRYAAEQAAAEVLGLDLSERMLERARAATTDPAVTYRQADLDALTLPPAGFGLAFSSLVLHYLVDLDGLFATVRQALVPGGRLVFSMEHPIFTAPTVPRWLVDTTGHTIWPVDAYALEGPRTVEWLGARVTKHHRTLGTILNSLIHAGFVVRHVEDWAPSATEVAADAALAVEWDRPMFLLVAAQAAEA